MNLLVTGADGFVGRWLVPRLLDAGHAVTGTGLGDDCMTGSWTANVRSRISWRRMDLTDATSVGTATAGDWDGVVHLAAMASGSEARQDPGRAWEINASGTARIAEALVRQRTRGKVDPLLLLISTGEVYGTSKPVPVGRDARLDTDALEPCSPYAASKLGGEIAAQEAARRSGLRVVIARAFPHTGPGQSEQYVVPAFARRLRTARTAGARVIKTGNLEPVRDFLDVRDVVEAYALLLSAGKPGRVYNVASGEGRSLREILFQLAERIGVNPIPEVDAVFARGSDIATLIGDASRLRADTGWVPRISFEQTLQDVVDAQAD
ncbi:MAG: GDP-mannose 4,6-dehydratase [Gemmatimonadota bacterium]